MTPAQKATFEAARAELDAPRLEERIPCCDVCRAHHGMRGVRFVIDELGGRRPAFACERCVRRMTSELWGGGLGGGAIARHEAIDHSELVDARKTVKP